MFAVFILGRPADVLLEDWPWLTMAAVLGASLFGAGFLLDSSSQPGERRTEHVLAHLVLPLWAAAAIAPCRYCV